MTDDYVLARIPAPLPAPAKELLPGEEMALARVAAAGRRAANWLRALPGPDGNWVAGDLADAVQEATSNLDPGDLDDVDRWGSGGVPELLRERLNVTFSLPHLNWLSPGDRMRVLAVTGCVLGMPKLLANDPVAALDDDLPVMCAILDHTVEDGAASRM